MASDETKPMDAPMEFKVDFQYPGGPAIYANHFVVQFDGDDFHLNFYEVQPPPLLGTAEEKKEMAQKLGPLVARSVARIVVAKGRIGTIAKVLYDAAKKNLGEDALK